MSGRTVRCLVLIVGIVLAAPVRGQKYVAVGDSITFGFGDDGDLPELGYPARLESLLVSRGVAASVDNRGISGETTGEALSRINSVLAAGYDHLLLMEGTNDINLRLSPETIRFNLDQIAQRAETRGMDVTLGTVIPRLPTANFDGRNRVTERLAQEIRGLANAADRGLADPFAVFLATADLFGKYYVGDGDNLHPNGEGYDALAVTFADALTGVDTLPPVTGKITPADDSQNVSPNVEVSVEVFDFGAGIDLTATSLLLNDEVVEATATGDKERLVLTYRSPTGFRGVPMIGLRTRDTATPVHTFDRVVTQFVVAGTVFLPGDVNRDGRVDGEDLVSFAVRFGAVIGEARYRTFTDFNGDGETDGRDLAILASNFGKSS